jgi:hypothetical protein
MGIPSDLSPILEDLNPWWREPGARKALDLPVRRGVHSRLLAQLLRVEDRRAQVVMGPRQVGKTTLLKQLSDDLLDRGWPARNLTYFDFEDFRLRREVDPEEIADLRPPGADSTRPQVFLLDEVHRVARWDRWLKYAVDNQLGRFVVTDSAASLLREAGRESGLGRWDNVVLEGLSFREFLTLSPGRERSGRPSGSREESPAPAADPQSLERYLALGGFPAYATSDEYPLVRERLRNDIVDKALRRDLEGRVDDPERLRRLFVHLVQQSGSELKPSHRAADLGVDPRTVAKWTDLLEDTLLIRELPRGSMSAKASGQLRGRPKLYAADHGLVSAFAEVPSSESEVRARVFEAVVYRHLREVVGEALGGVHYLKWGRDLELDFLAEVGDEEVAIEVTHSIQPRAEKRARLARAADRAGASRALLVHGGLAEGVVEGVGFVPIGSFLADPLGTIAGGGS